MFSGEIPILNVSYKPQKISPKFKASINCKSLYSLVYYHTFIHSLHLCVCFQGSVRALLHDKIRDAYTHPQFVTDVMKPMQIESIIDQDVSQRYQRTICVLTHVWYTDGFCVCVVQVQNLSGGELQRVALALCLGKPADVYLIDEPSAYLDSEQRLMAARVIKR